MIYTKICNAIWMYLWVGALLFSCCFAMPDLYEKHGGMAGIGASAGTD